MGVLLHICELLKNKGRGGHVRRVRQAVALPTDNNLFYQKNGKSASVFRKKTCKFFCVFLRERVLR
jgi:hypothetical protein